MSRLSIVIPCIQEAGRFEATLASVLQNRPEDCEVVVVQPRDYDDPYELRHEVCFVQAPTDSSLMDLIHYGVHRASGELVHLLSCDMEVVDGWTDAALGHFQDTSVGSVSPLVVAKEPSVRVVSRGVQLGSDFRRRIVIRSRAARGSQAILVPTLAAGIYRRQALIEAELVCAELGDDLTDVDLGTALQAAGYCCMHEADSVIVTEAAVTKSQLSQAEGRSAEGLFWRHADPANRLGNLLLHPLMWLTEAICHLHRPQIVMRILGRVQGWLVRAKHREHYQRLEDLRAETAARASVLPLSEPTESFNQSSHSTRAAA